ncbi:MFS transporter [Fructilactobacillus myrtifloralis]|uniref:MFS transporter n=1 Tax=Fructilactobacillus myrtifloralis TaxID=2940301 RepID=A0ABY5BMR9_9LACO|nr:MFS transporter [Fructilactobacillus myrtifloralis]USS84511.1 MFS transporter [Fructilactobacillus myrtifloralis]
MVIHKRRLSWSLYFNYFIHGFALIILAQNMTSLATSWQTTIAVVSYVMSGVGIGRLIAYPLTGWLSDRFSRKNFVYLGLACYFGFAIGMVSTTNLVIAYGLALLAGIGNSALDAGTYTTLVEINDGHGAGTVILKAFISVGEFILPLLVTSLAQHHLWFGWTFVVMALLILGSMVNLLFVRFPQPFSGTATQPTTQITMGHGRRWLATGCLALYGFTAMAVMIWFTQWITLFAERQLHFSTDLSHWLLSLYSIGSIIGVLALYGYLKRERSEKWLLIGFNLGTLVALLLVVFGTVPLVVEIGSWLFGVCAASGVMQLGLTWFMNLYPHRRGLVTGTFYFFGSLASLLVPLLSGWLSKTSLQLAFSANLLIALLGICLAVGATGAIKLRKDENHAK